jgi:peptidoglycan/xylan/chitin deacetylase (PgdA/CDA1 family)
MDSNSISLTIDIEDWYHIPSVCGSPFSVYRTTNEFYQECNYDYDYLSKPTEKILNLLDEFNVRATFFIVANIVYKYPGLIESIAERNHEIACHGLDHTCIIHPKTKGIIIDSIDFRSRTLKAKKILEGIYNKKISGYRAPNALISGWMLDILEEIGFKYDSSVSLNSLYNKTDSPLLGVSSLPYYPQKGSLNNGISLKRNIIEFPWPYYDMGIKIPTAGGPALRLLGANIVLKGLKQSIKRGHTIFYFHPIDISNSKFPRIGNGRPLYWLIKGDIVERRIRYILKNLIDVKKCCLEDLACD